MKHFEELSPEARKSLADALSVYKEEVYKTMTPGEQTLLNQSDEINTKNKNEKN